MNDLPAPPTAPDADLRNFKDMPLEVARLRDSDLATTPNAEVFRAAVFSWCASWHQVPAGSLPNDDATLARLLGWGRDLRGWAKVRAAGALRGWYLCSDGRLYHPTVAAKVVIALGAKHRRETDRKRLDDWRKKRGEMESEIVVETQSETRFKTGRSDRIGSDQIQKRENTASPSSDVSPREDYEETAAATTADSSAPGEAQPQTAAHRFRVVNTERIRRAVKDRDLPGILAGFAANPRYAEWRGAVIDMSLAAVVALLGWSVDQKFVVRAPSGFRKVREAWESLDPDERKRIGREQCQRYGVAIPTTTPPLPQEATP